MDPATLLHIMDTVPSDRSSAVLAAFMRAYTGKMVVRRAVCGAGVWTFVL